MGTTTPAVAYRRVSSAVQVDGTGLDRQLQAIQRHARAQRLRLVGDFVDEGVSGSLPLAERPGLRALLDRVRSNGVRLVVLERADRLARDLVEGELILREFRRAGVRVVEAESGNDLTAGDTANPTANLVRQVLGAVAEFEKSALVAKLQKGRRDTGRFGGYEPYGEDVVRQVRRLRRRHPRTGRRRGYGAIARELDRLGIPTRSGRPWARSSVRDALSR